MAPADIANENDFVDMQEEEEGESSPFLARQQRPGGGRALLRSGAKAGLGLLALLACLAAGAMSTGGQRVAGSAAPRAFRGGFDGLVLEAAANGTANGTETCPDGYVHTQLDMQNHDADMHEESASLEECAAKCDGDAECKGFEHNMVAQHCWVSRVGHHCTDKQHEDWISCVKGDSDACSAAATTGDEGSGGNATGNATAGDNATTTEASNTTAGPEEESPPAGASEETCPDGFVATHLDMKNHDADMHEESASLEDCAAKCNEDGECKGFEHSMVAQTCWVSRAGHHCTDKQQDGWISCIKGDSDACEDGGPNDE